MRHLRITFTTGEDKAGSILADLADKVSNLDFAVVEEVPFHRNKPAPAKQDGRKNNRRGTSVIPEIFAKTVAKKGDIVTVKQIKAMLAAHNMAPGSYSHAINTLRNARKIKAGVGLGNYEVL